MKKRPETFKFRLSDDERRAIADLAARLSRSQSDAVRFVVIEASRQLAQANSKTESAVFDSLSERTKVTASTKR